jgi:hypothetical protein
MTDNPLPATPETPKPPKSTEATRNTPPRKQKYFTLEQVRESLQTARGHGRHRQGLGLRSDPPMLKWEDFAPMAPENQISGPESPQLTAFGIAALSWWICFHVVLSSP